jgi:hypothetical protein
MLRLYSAARGLRYGRDVFLAFKGGNIFRMLFEAASRALGMSVAEWPDLLGLSDLDFEVHLKEGGKQQVREVSVLMAVAMMSVREYLIERLPPWTPSVEELGVENLRGATLGAARQADSIVLPAQGEPTCASCDTVYAAVPTVLTKHRGSGGRRTWYKTGTYRGSACPLPITYNLTLSRNFRGLADAELLRIRRCVGVTRGSCSRTCTAELFDLSITGNEDVKHLRMQADHGFSWFRRLSVDGRRVWAPSLRNLFEDIQITLMVTNARPWEAPRYQKRVARWVWVAVLLELVGGMNVARVRRRLKALATGGETRRAETAQNVSRIVREVRSLEAECRPHEASDMRAFLALLKETMLSAESTLSGSARQTLQQKQLLRCRLI